MNRTFAVAGFPLPGWLEGDGPAADLVLGTRALIVRNLAGLRFPGHAAPGELEAVVEEVLGAARKHAAISNWPHLVLAHLTEDQRGSLLEKLLISRTLANEPGPGALLCAPDLGEAVVLNDRDHLRLTAFTSGFDPQGALEKAQTLENTLEEDLSFAYQEALGYLSSEPTCLGTGLIFTALLHLPGLVMADQIDKVVNALHQLRFNVSGLRGEGATVRGALFRISSQVTLGKDEREIMDDFSFHVGKVLVHEKTAREQLHARDPLAIEDAVHRSMAVLRSARLITRQECFDRLSHLRLGMGLGLLPDLDAARLNRLLLWQQSSHLGLARGHFLEPQEILVLRASFLRENLQQGQSG